MSTVCHVNKENIILVPGNHDVARNDISEMTKESRSCIKNRELVSEKVIHFSVVVSNILQGMCILQEMFDNKIKAAQTMGIIYVDSTNLADKIVLL